MSVPKIQHAVVVGASSGIGREIVRELARGGTKVCAVARRADRLNELAAEFPGLVLPLIHDVTDFAAVSAAFQEATRLAGGLDLIVYASGVMPKVDFNEFSFEKDKAMVDVNILGLVAWLNEAASRMEKTRHGSIVCIGSRAGHRGLGSMPAYAATKAFTHSYMESLRNRVARYGVKVVTVMPGPVATEMTAFLPAAGKMDVTLAARKIIGLSNRTGQHFLKFSDRIAVAIIRLFPSGVLRKLKL